MSRDTGHRGTHGGHVPADGGFKRDRRDTLLYECPLSRPGSEDNGDMTLRGHVEVDAAKPREEPRNDEGGT